uniref:Putative ovule protein n=1 Tax=Solanum chacoense TaxID=4108 RepID=A0A0V0H209_SOLCH
MTPLNIPPMHPLRSFSSSDHLVKKQKQKDYKKKEIVLVLLLIIQHIASKNSVVLLQTNVRGKLNNEHRFSTKSTLTTKR